MGSVLVLLDLAAAFDTVDHETLLNRLRDWVGLSGTALDWFSSYLSNRMCRVSIKNYSSSISNIRYGAVADSECLKGRGEKIKRAHSGQHGAPPADTVAFLT